MADSSPQSIGAVAPDQVLANYGIEHSPTLALLGRLFGGALLTLAVILWLARDFRDETAIRAVLIGGLVGDVVNIVAATMGTLSGASNALGWSTVLIYLFAAVGSGYFLMERNIAAIAPVTWRLCRKPVTARLGGDFLLGSPPRLMSGCIPGRNISVGVDL